MAAKTDQTYFYEVVLLRKDRKITRQGNIHAPFPLDALDMIVGMARDQWKRTLLSTKLYEIGNGGTLDLIAQTTVGGEASEKLKCGIVHQIEDQTKQTNLFPFKGEPPPETGTKTTTTDKSWSGYQIGTTYVAPVFPVIKF
jgi:hypothetical protein